VLAQSRRAEQAFAQLLRRIKATGTAAQIGKPRRRQLVIDREERPTED
jgi:hypothetical protein